MKREDAIRSTSLQTRRTPHGWLALSGRRDPLRIGVFAATKIDAEKAFTDELEAWVRLAQMKDA